MKNLKDEIETLNNEIQSEEQQLQSKKWKLQDLKTKIKLEQKEPTDDDIDQVLSNMTIY